MTDLQQNIILIATGSSGLIYVILIMIGIHLPICNPPGKTEQIIEFLVYVFGFISIAGLLLLMMASIFNWY